MRFVAVLKRECETCQLVEPVLAQIKSRAPLELYCQDDPAFPESLGGSQDDTALDRSWQLRIETVPTLIRYDGEREAARIVGWDRKAWEQVAQLEGLGAGLPAFQPGCGSKTQEPGVPERLALKHGDLTLRSRKINVPDPEDAIETAYDRGWSDGLPVVLQNVGGQVGVPMRADAVVKLAQAVPAIRYVKEETLPSTHRISELLAVAGDTLDGVFGGSGGRALVDELQRGACGLMSGCQLVDAQVKVYNLLLAGDEAGARAAFARQLPAQTHWGSIGLKVAKEVLRRRGVFRTTVTRKPDRELDAHDHAEITWALGLAAPDLIPTGTLAGATR